MEDKVKAAGGPYLENLNKDPYLDRKVILPIVDGAPLTGGRSSRTSRHMLQLGLPGIDTDHVEFRM